MALGTFTAPQAGNFIPSTKFDVKANEGHPLVVIVTGYKEDFSTEQYKDPRPVVFVMIADLEPVKTGGKAVLYNNALLGGGAVADRLKNYAGAEDEDGNPVKLPVKLGKAKSKKTGNWYQTVEGLEGPERALVEAWDEKNPTALQDDRARAQALVDAEAEKNGGSAPAASSGAGTKFDDDALQAAISALKS